MLADHLQGVPVASPRRRRAATIATAAMVVRRIALSPVMTAPRGFLRGARLPGGRCARWASVTGTPRSPSLPAATAAITALRWRPLGAAHRHRDRRKPGASRYAWTATTMPGSAQARRACPRPPGVLAHRPRPGSARPGRAGGSRKCSRTSKMACATGGAPWRYPNEMTVTAAALTAHRRGSCAWRPVVSRRRSAP